MSINIFEYNSLKYFAQNTEKLANNYQHIVLKIPCAKAVHLLFFQLDGNIPLLREVLNNNVSDLTRETLTILINLGEMPSGPYDVLQSKFLIGSKTSFSRTTISFNIGKSSAINERMEAEVS